MQNLTDEQRRQWATNGYLHLEGVFSPDRGRALQRGAGPVRGPARLRAVGPPPRPLRLAAPREDLRPEGFMDRRHLLEYGEAFIELIDRSPVFDLIVDLMGPYVLLSMSQAIVRASTPDFPGYTHTDGGEALRAIRVTETSRPLAVKAMYLLSDVERHRQRQLHRLPRQPPAPLPGYRRELADTALAGRRPASGQGRRLLPVLAFPVARPGAQPFGQGSQDHPLQLLPAVPALLRLPDHAGHPGAAAHRASAACWATWGTSSGQAITSTRHQDQAAVITGDATQAARCWRRRGSASRREKIHLALISTPSAGEITTQHHARRRAFARPPGTRQQA